MSKENLEILRQIYEGIVDRPESVRHLYAPNYEMDLTDIAPDIGVVRGFDAQNEALRSYFDAFDGFHIEIDEVISATDDQVLVAIYDGGRMHGVDTEIRNLRFHLWSFRDGQVVRFSAHLDSRRALQAAGLSD
jgi:ketosteroid isomerase-like protein